MPYQVEIKGKLFSNLNRLQTRSHQQTNKTMTMKLLSGVPLGIRICRENTAATQAHKQVRQVQDIIHHVVENKVASIYISRNSTNQPPINHKKMIRASKLKKIKKKSLQMYSKAPDIPFEHSNFYLLIKQTSEKIDSGRQLIASL